MANTYTQIHIQAIFVVKRREALIHPRWETDLKKYITGIVQNNEHKLLAINGVPDHLHLLIGLRPDQSVSSLLQDIKGCSSKWINENELVRGKFEWQAGFAAFSYTKYQVPVLVNYIQKQKEHHAKQSFREEYLNLLNEFGVDYDERYIFTEPQ
jgi:REP element-mobilizing transposase RayT